MVNYDYSVAFSETLDILNHTKKEDVEKIPSKFLDFLKINALKTYESKLDFNKSIADMSLNQKTIGILSIIYKKYWCNSQQRKDFEEKLKYNEMVYHKQLSEKLNIKELFKNKELNILTDTDVTYLIEHKEQRWYQKIFKKFLCLFRKK